MLQENIKKIIDSQKFQNFIIGIIIFNGITMGFETSKTFSASYEHLFFLLDRIVIAIFTVELTMRIYVHRLSFFKDGWNLFDFFIVFISLLPANHEFEILRILRVLRLLRLITVVPQMRKIIMALAGVIPGMFSIGILLTLLFYISAIMATELYGETFPQWFGTLGESFYTLFQIMTLESWSMGIARPVMEVYPLAWTFFVPFIFIVTFIMINLIIAVVVDAMSELTQGQKNTEDEIEHQLEQLSKEMKELKELLIETKKSQQGN